MSNTPADFSNFFSFTGAHDPSFLHVKPIRDDAWGPFLGRDNLSKLTRGESLPTSPLRFAWSSGETPQDMISTEYSRIRLFSDRIFQCFTEKEFTGWATFPVGVAGKDGANVLGYKGLAVTGRCGPIDPSLSIRMPRPNGPPDKEVMMGLYFDIGSWDGSHIFTPNGGLFFIVEEVKLALEAIGATNIQFRRLSELRNHLATLRLRHTVEDC
jgi:hypothetical protein